MSAITQQILEDMENLPPEMQAEALDFVRFLKTKLVKTEAVPQPGYHPQTYSIVLSLGNRARTHCY